MKADQFLRTLGVAIQEAHGAIESYSLSQFLEQYFDRTVILEERMGQEKEQEKAKEKAKEKEGADEHEGREAYVPKMIEIVMPSEEDRKPGKVLYTPIATLVQHRHLNLDHIKLNLNISVLEETEDDLQVAAQGVNMQSDGSREYNAGTLEITFKCSDTAEGIARIETRLNGML